MSDGRAKPRVLVVEDDPQVRATISDALLLEGYVVTTAANGADALSMIPNSRPDVIVFDLWMPVIDGWDFRRAQLAAHPEIPVVVLSALDMRNERLAELRADALIAKPFDLDELYAAVAKVLRRL